MLELTSETFELNESFKQQREGIAKQGQVQLKAPNKMNFIPPLTADSGREAPADSNW
ncbi:MAG: hypothetical protein ACWGMZ_01720 [Thermoguttaceae bacterium]